MNTLPQYEADDGPLSSAQYKQLAEKAGIYIAYDNRAALDKELEFFAELIVRECAGIADKAEPYKASDLIKQHFGVEDQVQDSKELHTCPYLEEINGDYETLCDCDEEQQHQCAMDI